MAKFSKHLTTNNVQCSAHLADHKSKVGGGKCPPSLEVPAPLVHGNMYRFIQGSRLMNACYSEKCPQMLTVA